MVTTLVSMGDPAGIGPELAVKAWKQLRHSKNSDFVLIGDYQTIADECAKQSVEAPKLLNNIEEFSSDSFASSLQILCPKPLSRPAIYGEPDSVNGAAIIEYIRFATMLCLENRAKSLVTLPISKSVLYQAGFEFAGHTEFIADICATHSKRHLTPVMMLMAGDIKVSLVTIHIPVSAISNAINGNAIKTIVEITHNAIAKDFGIKSPKIAILGLNPHAGESGSIGREEVEIINPICAQLRSFGIDCTDAIPADSAFSPQKREYFDAYVAMYHDQGLIPVKTIDFWGGVNVTLGLPIIRTSPDHGTGFEIAGKNIANPQSFLNAIKTSNEIYENRKKAVQ